MKNKIKLGFLVISFSLFFLLFIFDSYNLRDINPRENNPIDNINPIERDIVPIQSDSLIVSPITIDDLNIGINDWATINATYAWCNGAGTFSNPYIIENVTIDAGGTGNGILIANSSVYFIIRNCTLHNSGHPTEIIYAGIKLDNTDNGQLINNTCSNTNMNGILLMNGCDNNTISGNTANNNTRSGIWLIWNSNYNTISGNTANNTRYGIYLTSYCDNNTISGNTVNNNTEYGIWVYYYCDKNTISDNFLYNNGEKGIFFHSTTENNYIYKNTFGGNTIHACDDGTNNFWDNGTVGNLWVDYDGVDVDGDGIGDIAYNISGTSNKKDYHPIYPIPRPINMDIHQDIGYNYLYWDEPTHYIFPIIRYNIYRGETEGGSKTYLGYSSITEFYDMPPFNNTMYYYIVRTVNALGESENSTEVSGMAMEQPFVQWKTPYEEEVVVLPVGDAVFNFKYDCAAIDNITLEINGTDFGSIWNVNSTILSPYTVDIDGRVNATLWGYQTGIPTPIVNDTRTFIFTKLISEVHELLDSNNEYLGQQLYLILHDPCGDNSFSSFVETTTISIGIGGSITSGASAGLAMGAEYSFFGIGIGASFNMELKTSVEQGYEYRYEITDITELTSSLDSSDKDYIGPIYGDRYWGEAWTLKWELKAYHRTYFNGSAFYEEPKLAYGIIRSGEVLLNDYNAPQAWRDLNPAHNGWQNVNWIDNLTITGGSPYSKTQEVTTTQKQTKFVEIGISMEARTKLSFGGCYVEASVGVSVSSKNYREQEETNAYEVSLTIYDDESTDTIVQEYGIDTLFGTYIFRTNEFMCETSYPLEHNTTDYIPPIIDFPIVVLDSSQDGLYPCKDDSPIITIEIFDEGGIQQALLWFSINDGANWDSAILSEQPANPGTWQASIPSHDHGTTVLWYIQVWDLQGLSSTRKDPNENLYRFIVINRAPTLSLISPNGGDAFKDSVLIEWSASDLDGDSLTFTLAYGDGSGGWYFIEDGITGTSYEWDITNIPYSDSILIKIIAYDGFGGQAEDQSDFLFTIGEAPLFELNEVIIPVTLITMIGGLVGLAFLIFRSNQSLKKKLDVMEKRIKSYETRIKPKGKSIQEKIQEESLDLKDRTNLREKK